MTALNDRLLALAADFGRLRRRLEPGTYNAFLAARVADHVDSLDAMHEPTAAELYQAGMEVEAALQTVDARAAELRRLLGDHDAGVEWLWERSA